MSHLFYTNMQKRGDGKVYADLHKTDYEIYFTPEDAQATIDSDPPLQEYRHVVPLVAMTEAEFNALMNCVASLGEVLKAFDHCNETYVPQLELSAIVREEAEAALKAWKEAP